MKVKEFAQKLNLTISSGKEGTNQSIKSGYCGDLLSDVMANAAEKSVWLTIQTHQNIVAVGNLKDLSCIVITGGNVPDDNTVAKAQEEKIPLLLSRENTFELCMKIAELEIFH